MTEHEMVDRAYEAFQDEYYRLNSQRPAREADEHDEYQREAMYAAVRLVRADLELMADAIAMPSD